MDTTPTVITNPDGTKSLQIPSVTIVTLSDLQSQLGQEQQRLASLQNELITAQNAVTAQQTKVDDINAQIALLS